MYKRMRQIMFVFFISVGLLACSQGPSPEETIKNFYSAIEKKDMDKAIAQVYLEDLETSGMVTEEKLKMMLYFAAEAIQKEGGLKEIKINSVEYSEDKSRANVMITIIKNDGKSNIESMELVNHQGEWKLLISSPDNKKDDAAQ